MSYRVHYHIGKEMNLRCRMHFGNLTLTDEAIVIDGEPGCRIPYRDIVFPSQYFRLHFLCRMVELTTHEKKLFLTIPLIGLLGRTIVSNFGKLMQLVSELDPRVRNAWIQPKAVTS